MPTTPEGRLFSPTAPMPPERVAALGRLIDTYRNALIEDAEADDLERLPIDLLSPDEHYEERIIGGHIGHEDC